LCLSAIKIDPFGEALFVMREVNGIIDSHIHLYPPDVISDPAGWAKEQGESYWPSLVMPSPGRRSSQGWVDLDRLLRDMDEAGVERAVLLGWYWENHATCVDQNRFYGKCIQAHSDRLLAFAGICPSSGPELSIAELKWSRDNGFIGMGELCPYVQGGSFDDKDWQAVFTWAMENEFVVNLHVSEPVGRNYPGKIQTPLLDFQKLIEEFPELKVILAHWGGGLAFYEANWAIRKAFKNVFYDTAASPLIYRRNIFTSVTLLAGSDKILFGSDYPLILYPKTESAPDLRRFVEEARSSGLSEVDTTNLLRTNAEKLFGIS
jgi:predicted TIM-barrel fold metal-dependent hydrolase